MHVPILRLSVHPSSTPSRNIFAPLNIHLPNNSLSVALLMSAEMLCYRSIYALYLYARRW